MINSRRIATGLQIVAIAGMLALAACGRDDEGETTSGNAPGQLPADISLPLKPGKWEKKVIFTEIKVPSLGNKKKQDIMNRMSKAASKTICLSPKQATRPTADFFGAGVKGACKYRDFRLQQNEAEMGLVCAVEGMAMADMQLSGNIDTEQFALDVTSDLRLPMIGKVSLSGKAEGRLLGACEE